MLAEASDTYYEYHQSELTHFVTTLLRPAGSILLHARLGLFSGALAIIVHNTRYASLFEVLATETVQGKEGGFEMDGLPEMLGWGEYVKVGRLRKRNHSSEEKWGRTVEPQDS